MKKKYFVSILLLFVSLLAAENCHKLEIGGYKIKIYPEPVSFSVKEDSSSYSCSALIEFDGNGLTITGNLIGLNGKLVGMFPSGSELSIKNGKIYVDGKEPDTISDIQLSFAFSRTNTYSNVINFRNFSIESKPYYTDYTKYSCKRNGKDVHFFVAGDYNVEIDGDVLLFNFESYGKLKPGDSILIDKGKVSIKGVEASPKS